MVNDELVCEQNLIAALKAGDEKAFTTIYKQYWYKMFLVAYRKLRSREIAEELIQDIFTRLWRDRTKLQILNLNFYLFSAVRYEVIDIIRVRGSQDAYLDYYQIRVRGSQDAYLDYYQAFASFEDYNTENTVAFNDLIKTIDDGLEELPEKSKEIFKLSRLENWSVPQIAAHFQLTEKAIEYHITKATKYLRLYLNESAIFIFLLAAFTF